MLSSFLHKRLKMTLFYISACRLKFTYRSAYYFKCLLGIVSLYIRFERGNPQLQC